MKTLIALVLALAFIGTPSGALAASAKPTVVLTEPSKGGSYDRTEEMDVSWDVSGITRDVVVVTNIKLVKQDAKGPSVGAVSGSGYQHTVHAGDTDGGFTHDWGLNDTVPGKYSIGAEVRECNKKGCDYAPAGKLLSKKAKAISITVRNDGGWVSNASSDSETYLELLSPTGGEKYVAGSGRKLSIKWYAEGVPKGSTVCTVLEKQGGSMFAFPGEKSCKKAKNGKDSMTGTLIRNAGYDLGPGNYWVRINLFQKATGGKDGATLADAISDEPIRLVD